MNIIMGIVYADVGSAAPVSNSHIPIFILHVITFCCNSCCGYTFLSESRNLFCQLIDIFLSESLHLFSLVSLHLFAFVKMIFDLWRIMNLIHRVMDMLLSKKQACSQIIQSNLRNTIWYGSVKKQSLCTENAIQFKMMDFEDVILGLHLTLATVLHTD